MQTFDVKEITVTTFQAQEIKLHVGEEVFDVLEDKAFQSAWDRLYAACPWATLFQSRAFVASWYQLYRKNHLPVLVKSVRNGKLNGLLTMTMLNAGSENNKTTGKKQRIVGAGHFDAEYQSWLSEESEGALFIKAALGEIRRQFPGHEIQFRYIPQQAPLDWITQDGKWKPYCVVQTFRRPLMDVTDDHVSKLTGRHDFKRKVNRLKKAGTIKLERIVELEQFRAVLNELILQYDFRQGAKFNKNRFAEDPEKKDLLLAMFEHNLLHVTLLKVNERIFGSIVATVSNNCVHIGAINTHTPFKAFYYSPGYVHFRMFAKLLLQEGASVLDLTPGGDFYKETLASRHDQVYELLITNSPVSRLKRRIRKQAHSKMTNAGIWPMGLEVALIKRVYLFKSRLKMIKRQGLVKFMKDRAQKLMKSEKQNVYLLPKTPVHLPVNLSVHRDSLPDMLAFEAKGTWLTRWEFLEDAMRRFEVGEHSYTWCEEGRLLACAWLREAASSEGKDPSLLPTGAVVLADFYCHPAGRERLEHFLTAVTAAAARDCKEAPVYALASTKEATFSRALEAIGLQTTAN